MGESGNKYVDLTASATIKATPAKVAGFYVSSTTAGTIQFFDSTDTSVPITGVITPAIGWHALGNLDSYTLLRVVIGGTLNATVVYK